MAAMAPSTASTPVANTPPAVSAAPARASPKPSTPPLASSAASPISSTASALSSVLSVVLVLSFPRLAIAFSASFNVELPVMTSSPSAA